jgi:threonine/homoserine/homoserine lactone efflux protein
MFADLLPLIGFAFVASITPGPNNTLLMISGANWGFRASLPLLLGVVTGFLVMLFAVGMGLGGAFEAWPFLHQVLKWACFAYLLVLAWKVARSGGSASGDGRAAKPLSFLSAATFQWINPKAWIMSVSALAVYVPVGAPHASAVLKICLVFLIVGSPCCLSWCLGGSALSRFLRTPRRVRIFNVTMAVLLVASMLPTLF